jgi:hypothetical protein
MATVTNWIDHLSADEVVGAVYPGAGSSETLLGYTWYSYMDRLACHY